MRQQQKRKLNASLNNLVAILDEYFPEYQEVFKTLAGKASQHVLRHTPFPEDILKFTVEELAQELKGATSNRVGEKKAALLLQKAMTSIGIKEGLAKARLRLSNCME